MDRRRLIPWRRGIPLSFVHRGRRHQSRSLLRVQSDGQLQSERRAQRTCVTDATAGKVAQELLFAARAQRHGPSSRGAHGNGRRHGLCTPTHTERTLLSFLRLQAGRSQRRRPAQPRSSFVGSAQQSEAAEASVAMGSTSMSNTVQGSAGRRGGGEAALDCERRCPK